MQTKDELRQEIESLKKEIENSNEKANVLKTLIDSKNREIENAIKQRDTVIKENEDFRNSVYETLDILSDLLNSPLLKGVLTDVVGDIVKENISLENDTFSEMYGHYGETVNLYWGNTRISSTDITLGCHPDD